MALDFEDLKYWLPNPVDIVKKLDGYIIGQEKAKKTLAIAVLNRALIRLRRFGHLESTINLQKSNVLLIGPTGCVDFDIEFMSRSGWKRIADWNNEDVLQYRNGKAEFIYPNEYHKYPCDYLTHIQSKYGISQILSDEHNFAYVDKRKPNKVLLKPFKWVKERWGRFCGKVITSFDFEGQEGINISDNELRLMIAINADGYLTNSNTHHTVINVKKQYKKDRIQFLLNECHILFKVHNKGNSGFTTYSFHAPFNKGYTKEYYKASKHQLKIISDEIVKWDGNRKNIFRTTLKESADLIQFVWSSLGYRGSIISKDRPDKGHVEYIVLKTEHNLITGIRAPKPAKYKTKDGFKYCFTVPSGLLILRNNGKIFVTGNSGKTSLMKALSEIEDIPISISDVTSITSAGYVGGKIEDILVTHVNNCEMYVDKHYDNIVADMSIDTLIKPTKADVLLECVENGIVFIDEVDKICMRYSAGKDINGEMVQNELLKMLEGHDISLGPSHKPYPRSGMRSVNTKDLIFVCGGAFTGLEDIISKRLNKNNSIGFSSDIKTNEPHEILIDHLLQEDLIEFGFKPEFLGRIPLIAPIYKLDLDTMMHIITEPYDAILKQYQSFFDIFGVTIVMKKTALKLIAQLAINTGMGARSLKALFNKLFENDIYNIFDIRQSPVLVITRSTVEKRCGGL